MPNCIVANVLQCQDRKRFVAAFELLQAGDVGRLALQPFQKIWQTSANSIYIEGGDFHARLPFEQPSAAEQSIQLGGMTTAAPLFRQKKRGTVRSLSAKFDVNQPPRR